MARAICWRPPSAPTSPSPAECDHFCDLGELGPDKIKVPGMFVDMILA